MQFTTFLCHSFIMPFFEQDIVMQSSLSKLYGEGEWVYTFIFSGINEAVKHVSEHKYVQVLS